MSKHTPAPWSFAFYAMSPKNVVAARKLGIEPARMLANEGQVSITAQDGERHICFVTRQVPARRGQGYKTECAERDANAHLIAAAPDLLAAVRAFIAEHENLEDGAFADPGCIECNMGAGPHKATCAYHLGRAAVRKAEAAPS